MGRKEDGERKEEKGKKEGRGKEGRNDRLEAWEPKGEGPASIFCPGAPGPLSC